MDYPERVEQIARSRVARAHAQIRNSLGHIAEGNPLASEPDPTRLRNRLQTKALLSREEAEAIVLGIHALSKMPAAKRLQLTGAGGPEAIYGRTIDFVGISFLDRGQQAARAVARVAFRNGSPQGTGFMVSDRLFLTNNHVIASPDDARQFCIEFDYELDPEDRPRGPTRFVLDPGAFFLTDSIDDLDYTLIAVGDRLAGPRALDDIGWCGLSDAPDKHALGEVANIVQHPDGRYKEVVLRENSLVARLEFVLHYAADTEPGSSGSPVFNNEWKVIALHHWGGPWRQRVDDHGRRLPREINEGIRISAIVQDLRAKMGSLDSDKGSLLQRVVAGEAFPVGNHVDSPHENGTGGWRLDGDGRVTWNLPIEISVRLPQWNRPSEAPAPSSTEPFPGTSGGEAKVKPSTDYSDRSGYKEGFIEGFKIGLPKLNAQQKKDVASNKQAQPGDDPHELKYHHFSIVMNRKRRLAYFTACNIDGSKSKHVDRKTGLVTPLDPKDPQLESSTEPEGAEASDTWYDDKRLDPHDYAGREIYEQQTVPGFLDPKSMARTLRMFQRGHLVRRMDPAWGTDKQALLADADTFHWTNCSPQVGFFNMGKAPHLPGTGGGRLWRALENYVLRNAALEKSRVTCFTGPVFGQHDRAYRTIHVPSLFWKIIVWAEHGSLRSLAMIADQRPVIKVWPEALGIGREAFGDPDELDKVQDFLTTVKRVEGLTKLDFGQAVRSADIRIGGDNERIHAFTMIPLTPRNTRRRRKSGRRK